MAKTSREDLQLAKENEMIVSTLFESKFTDDIENHSTQYLNETMKGGNL